MTDEAPKYGDEDVERGLVWDGKDWVTRSQFRIWELDRQYEQWLLEQGVRPPKDKS